MPGHRVHSASPAQVAGQLTAAKYEDSPQNTDPSNDSSFVYTAGRRWDVGEGVKEKNGDHESDVDAKYDPARCGNIGREHVLRAWQPEHAPFRDRYS